MTRFVLGHVNGLPTPDLMQSDAGRVQLLTRTEDPITESMRSCEEVDVADSATTPAAHPQPWHASRGGIYEPGAASGGTG